MGHFHSFTYQLMNIWVFLRLAIISSKVAADTVYEFCVAMFHLGDTYLGVKLPGHVVTLRLCF